MRAVISALDSTVQPPFAISGPALNAEAAFARGIKIKLSDAALPDLELIPSLGTTLAGNIDLNRDAILSAARHLSIKDACFAFETIKGFGPKKRRAACSRLLPE